MNFSLPAVISALPHIKQLTCRIKKNDVASAKMKDCNFCKIIASQIESNIVFADEISLAFLDYRPLFPGHCLLVPNKHYETILDIPEEIIGPFFSNAKLIAQALGVSLHAEGSFIAINNKISQSVPHLHIHIVPRRKGDGLRAFWPRQKYKDAAHAHAVQDSIRVAIEELLSAGE